VTDEDARRRARQAIVVTAAIYIGFGLMRQLSPWAAGFLLVGAFYFVPMRMLRDRPDLATEDQVGPETPVPPWRWRGLKVAAVAGLVVFPPFCLLTLWFYLQICSGDTTLVDPALWVESHTPWEGRLEVFLRKLCREHPGTLWPESLVLPRSWTAYGGLGWVLEVLVGVFAIALPEEVFHRGYLMGALERRWPPSRRVFGVPFGWAAVLSSLLFAVGHLVGMAETARLATFFPALVFAWLWRRSGSLWAPALFHAAANLMMELMLASTLHVGA
jgi:membrane protease YdiL (CAAX protease family)